MNIAEQVDLALNEQILQVKDFQALSLANQENIKQLMESEHTLVQMLDNVRTSLEKARMLQQAHIGFGEVLASLEQPPLRVGDATAINPDVRKAIQSSGTGLTQQFPSGAQSREHLVAQKPSH